MKKTLIIITAFSLLSCGSMKKDTTSTETKSKTDLNASTIDKSNEVGGSFILRPFNPSKPIINGKDTIFNATIEKHYYTKDRIVKDTISKKEEQTTDIDTKNVERDNTELFRGIAREFFILLIILFVINLAYKHFTKPKN
jgi:maltose-binding protein MalE